MAMRRIPLIGFALLAAAGCTSEAPTAERTDQSAAPAAAAGKPSPVPTPAAAGASNLRAEVSGLNADVSGLDMRVTDTATIVALPTDALFAFDSAELGRDAAQSLAKTADLIRSTGGTGTIQVVGHTDGKGAEDYNRALSERRAQAVVGWFGQQAGVRQRRFQVSGKGKSEPRAPEVRADGSDDAAGRARNRRVEVILPR